MKKFLAHDGLLPHMDDGESMCDPTVNTKEPERH